MVVSGNWGGNFLRDETDAGKGSFEIHDHRFTEMPLYWVSLSPQMKFSGMGVGQGMGVGEC